MESPSDTAPPNLVLASESPTRRAMLSQAGLDFTVAPARLDEDALKASLAADGARARDVAELLARSKAERVSARMPGALVVGADQILLLDERIFDKPADLAAARARLRALSGRPHGLISAVAVARDGHLLWHHRECAELVMRDLSEAFIDRYLGEIGEVALQTVGAYALEGLGAQLFTRVSGDHFTILGLPLLALLAFLREQGVLMR